MNDAAEMVFSWIVIFLGLMFVLALSIFLGETNELNTFHSEVNPIVEDYGGDSHKDLYKTNTDAQHQIQNATNRWNHRGVWFTVTPAPAQGSTYNNSTNQEYPDDFVPSTGTSDAQSASDASKADIDGNTVENHAVAGYGKPVAYDIHMHVPFQVKMFNMNHVITTTIRCYTTSKVGGEN